MLSGDCACRFRLEDFKCEYAAGSRSIGIIWNTSDRSAGATKGHHFYDILHSVVTHQRRDLNARFLRAGLSQRLGLQPGRGMAIAERGFQRGVFCFDRAAHDKPHRVGQREVKILPG